MPDDTDFDYHQNKKTGKTYVSRRVDGGLRIASKVIDSDGLIHEVVLKDEVVLRKTRGGRQEIVAKFYEGVRRLHVVTIQRWNTLKGIPQEKAYFSFVGSEIELLQAFLSNIVHLHFPDAGKVNVQDSELRTVVTTTDQARAILAGNLNLFIQLAENEVTERDIVNLGYRRKQLALFEKMLGDQDFFVEHAAGRKPEAVWQAFFEANPWVFGYGLSYIFMDSLAGKELEQTVRGFSVAAAGKRSDALMKTRAEVSSLCFVEIKRHDTSLLASDQYRPGVWSASKDLVGGICQVQETVRAAIRTLSAPFRPADNKGNPTGEEIFGFEPRSYLVIGSLSEFASEHGTNEDKFRSFEIFRRNIRQPEIITYDELLHRARFIVSSEVIGVRSKALEK
jgi:hypothetical protein